MTIREAILKAQESTGYIYKNDKYFSKTNRTYLKPTDEVDRIEMFTNGKKIGYMWNPSKTDLIAEDWEVYDPADWRQD